MPTKVTVTSMSEEVAHYESTTKKYCNGLKVKTFEMTRSYFTENNDNGTS